MTPEDIIREATAYTELIIEQRSDKNIRISDRYRMIKEFPEKILAILRDEVY